MLNLSPYSLNCHIGDMLVFRTLCRITLVFRHGQNWVGVSDRSRTDSRSEFQSVGPETAKHLWLYLVVLKRGTARSPRAAERRWPRLAYSDYWGSQSFIVIPISLAASFSFHCSFLPVLWTPCYQQPSCKFNILHFPVHTFSSVHSHPIFQNMTI